MEYLFFDFYGAAAVRINTQIPAVASFFSEEYAFHRVDSIHPDEPCVILNFSKDPPVNSHWSPHTHKFIARWSYAIELYDSRVVLNVSGNQFAIPMVHHMMVHAALRYLVSYQNTMLLHSGGVASNGQSILFTGRGGSGKTTTTSVILSSPDKRWALHADDYVFIKPSEGTYAYLTRAHLYRDLLSWIPGLNTRLTPSEWVRLEAFGRIRSWSGEKIKWPVRMALDRLWPEREMCRHAERATLVLLKRGNVEEPCLSRVEPGSDLIESLLEMNFYEARHFQALLRKNLTTSRADPLINDWRERERNILTSWIQQAPVYKLVLPVRGLPRDEIARLVLEQLTELVEPGHVGHIE